MAILVAAARPTNSKGKKEIKKAGQVDWLLGLLICSNCTKNIHEFENKTIDLNSLLLQEMKNILRASLRRRQGEHPRRQLRKNDT
eukprot:1140166-Pelagomonas_calceolata.AAC.1